MMTTDDAVTPACLDCRYWEPPDEGAPGDCRRYPPVIDFVGDQPVTAWPVTNAGDWCGEFRPTVDRPRS